MPNEPSAVLFGTVKYWRSKVDEFEEPKDVFNAVKWNRTEGTLPIFPLKEGDRLHSSTDDKANYLVSRARNSRY